MVVWAVLFSVFFCVPGIFYFHMKRVAERPWNLKTDRSYNPSITVLVPAHNEEKTIQFKLGNTLSLEWEGEKEFVVIDDGSTDKTLDEVCQFERSHPEANIIILSKRERTGKGEALNYGLEYAEGDIIIVTDADCFLPRETLSKALPFLADPSVGAVMGRPVLLNPEQSWVTRSEKIYLENYALTMRVGESKTHSTIVSTGGFCAYKRSFIESLHGDSETALDINQKRIRTILVPEVVFFTTFPSTMKDKMKTKIRRANQLVRVFVKCMALMLKKRLHVPKRLVIPRIYLYIVNPLVFLALLVTTSLLLFEFPVLVFFVLSPFLVSKSRLLFSEAFLANCSVLSALFACLCNWRFQTWPTVQESRLFLNKQTLEREDLPLAAVWIGDERARTDASNGRPS